MKQETIFDPALGAITIDLLTSIEKHLGKYIIHIGPCNYASQAVNKVYADSSNAAHWYDLASIMPINELAWQCYALATWLDSDSFKYKLGLFKATFKLGTPEKAFEQFNSFCTQIHNDNERAEIIGIFARYLVDNNCVEQAFNLISDLHHDNRILSMVRLDIGLRLLELNQPMRAIKSLESIQLLNLENEHYIIKRSTALISAYRHTGQYEAEQREWYFLQNFMFPAYAWKYEGWWGDAAKLLNKSPTYALRH
jgi:hypothetical protein